MNQISKEGQELLIQAIKNEHQVHITGWNWARFIEDPKKIEDAMSIISKKGAQETSNFLACITWEFLGSERTDYVFAQSAEKVNRALVEEVGDVIAAAEELDIPLDTNLKS